jgi:CrcB protein
MRLSEVNPYVWVAVGGALGSAFRYWSYGFVYRFLPETFPWGTLWVNILGSAFIGFFAALTAAEGRLLVPSYVRLFVMPGICGGFTTFSTFSLETINLARGGEFGKAGINVAASVLFCLLGAWVGHVMATALNER